MTAPRGSAAGGGHLRGIALLIGAVCCFAILDSIGKLLTQSYPIPLVVWGRYFFHVLIMVVVLWPKMGSRLIRTRAPGTQIARGLALGVSTVSFVSAISMMPLAEASAITQIAPVLLAILAVYVLGERAPPGTWWALGVSLVGVMLIVRPGGQVFAWVAVLPLLTAVSIVIYQLLTRKLAGIDDGLAMLFIAGLVATIIASAFLPWFWQMPRTWTDAALFVAMGGVGAFSHFLMVRAFERTPASVLAPYIYLQVVAALFLGWMIFGDFPDLTALAGIGLIALTGMTMAATRRRTLLRMGPGDPVIAGAVLSADGAPPVPAVADVPAVPIAEPIGRALPAPMTSSTPLRAVLLVVGATSLFSMLDTMAKYLSQSYHPLMVAWARYVFHVVVMVAIFAPSMGARLFMTRRPGVQIVRGLCLGMSTICFFTSVALLPLAEASSIVAIAPVLVTVGAVLLLGERAPSGTWLALAFSFCGVLLIVRPGSALFGWPALLPLLTAVFSMGYQLLTRQLSGVEDGLATLFIGGAVAALLLSLVAPASWSMPKSPLDASLFVATGAIGALSHLMLVRAFALAPASALAPFGYMHAVAALVFGLIVFGQFPDRLALAGLALIVITGVVMALKGRLPQRA